ncbi:MAG: O-Antigen ligase family protein [Bacillales bacterium]|jgi:hypothetical protein|nr:O-Antigen ligase family protein [Bacillales bacterium]
MLNLNSSNSNVEGITDLTSSISKIDKFLYSIIAILLVIIPIFVFPHVSTLVSPSLLNDPFGTGKKLDVYSYYNFIFLTIGSFLLLVGFLYKIIIEKFVLKNSKFNFIVMGIFMILVISTFLSVNKNFALFGFYERYEGAISYFCYFIVFFVLFNIKLSRKQIIGIILCLTPFLLVNLVLGIAKFFDVSLLNEGYLKFLNLSTKAKFNSDARLITTMYNPNYTSGAASVLFSLFFSLTLFLKDRVHKVIAFILAICSTALIITSTSFGGTLLFLIFLPLIIIVYFWYETKIKLTNILLIFSFVFVTGVTVYFLANYSEDVWYNTVGPFIGNKDPNKPFVAKSYDYSFLTKSVGPIEDNDSSLEFKNKSYTTDYKLPKIPEPGKGAGSGRLYIWQQTLEVFKAHPFFGTGLETLPLVVNQNDPQKIANFNTERLVILNPHSTYLAWLYGGGIFFLLGFVLFILAMGIDFVRNLYKRTDNVIIISFGFAIMAYFMQAALNDTRIGSSFIIWVLIGVFCNQLYESQTVKSKNNSISTQ